MAQIGYLDIHGVRIAVVAARQRYQSIAEALLEDFSFFRRETPPSRIDILLILGKLPRRVPSSFLRLKTKRFEIEGFGRRRVCRYRDGSVVVSRIAKRRLYTIAEGSAGTAGAGIYESGYFILLSAVGEKLDRRGWHKFHALAISRAAQGFALLLPSGAGKSTLAWRILHDSRLGDWKLCSDEIPVIRAGKLYPFPLRIGLLPQVAGRLGVEDKTQRSMKRRDFGEKLLYAVDGSRVSDPVRLKLLLIGVAAKAPGQKPRLEKVSRWAIFLRLIRDIGFGWQTPQMSEHLVRFDSFFPLVWVFLSRLRCAWFLSNSVDAVAFVYTPDYEANLDLLRDVVSATSRGDGKSSRALISPITAVAGKI